MKNDKIDIVYLWVDGYDKNWAKEKDKWYKKITGKTPVYKSAVGVERFRDNGELKYSLRSVAECTPWVNHIYIITGFNQIPKWLDTTNPKITIVSHEQIMPKSAIPTFNSSSIEMCIPNIKNLSEKFLLMNDDTFFNKPLKPSFFFDKHGRTKFNYSKNSYNSKIPFDKWKETLDGYTQTLALSAKYIDDMFGIKMYNMRPSHGIDPYLKSSWIECRNTKQLKKQIDNQINNKFRTNNEIQRWTMNMYDFATGRSVFHHSRAIKHGKKHRLSNWLYNIIHTFSIKNSNVVFTNAVKAKDAIKKAATFCMNDSQDNNEEILKSNREFLEQRFPNKCEFEK
ncbi:MAG: hypothetical protein IJV03_01855 [Alphaproteobacteria bacterium]|nr:hypothetical protein [Alphaproteobacteria bacterium]